MDTAPDLPAPDPTTTEWLTGVPADFDASAADRDPGGIAATLTAVAGALTAAALAQGAPWWVALAGTVLGTGAQLWARLRAWAPVTVARHARQVASEARDEFGDELEVLAAALEEARKAKRRQATAAKATKATKARKAAR